MLRKCIGYGLFFCLVFLSAASGFASDATYSRERLLLDKGWRFHLGDIPFPDPRGHADTYLTVKAGNAAGAAAQVYDDSSWRLLDLPHDWAVETPFDESENMAQGYRARGIGWYRRYIQLDESDKGKHIELQFDGIATHSTVWVNGNEVSHNWSGYNTNLIDITPYLRYGDLQNTIAIRVDAVKQEGWWYEGAGIYRHTWLVKRSPVHVITDGVKFVPENTGNNLWNVPVEVRLENTGRQLMGVDVVVQVSDPNGKLVAEGKTTVSVPVLAQANVNIPLSFQSPELWSIENTNLYKVTTSLLSASRKIDETVLYSGFRTIHFDAAKGFFLNGKSVKLKGICMHQDHAGVGVAIPESIWEFRLRRLKEMGVNAIRFSHNAPSQEVLDMVDRMGFVVMDENRNFNPSPDYMKQLEWMVKRDRHHPSIILWSVFNEEPVQATEVGYEMVRRMVAVVKALDTSRPTTAAMNGGFFSPLNVSHAVDVVGFNYQVKDYDRFHQLRPNVPMTSSEDTSALMTRGEYVTDPIKNTMSSYDNSPTPWGNTHRDAWEAIDKRDFVAGGFVWTGFDYRGEPTPYKWPSTSSFFGIMDLNGFAKDAFYIHQVQWIKDRPLIHIAPHWNWRGQEGKPIEVVVMANTDSVQLTLNGRQLGMQKTDPYRMNSYWVPYEAGKLEAVGFKDGRPVAFATVETTGDAVALKLIPDKNILLADGLDAVPITVQAVDAQGRVVPEANPKVTFRVVGQGKSLGHGNGDPNSHENEKGDTRHLFHGLAQLIVQAGDRGGRVKIEATAQGLRSSKVTIPVVDTPSIPRVSAVEPIGIIANWQVSPAQQTPWNPNLVLAENDMNSWTWAQLPIRMDVESTTTWRLYRASFTPREEFANGSGKLVFKRINGRAEVWLDGQFLAKTNASSVLNWSVSLPAGKGVHQLTLMVESEVGEPSGILDLVKIQK